MKIKDVIKENLDYKYKVNLADALMTAASILVWSAQHLLSTENSVIKLNGKNIGGGAKENVTILDIQRALIGNDILHSSILAAQICSFMNWFLEIDVDSIDEEDYPAGWSDPSYITSKYNEFAKLKNESKL